MKKNKADPRSWTRALAAWAAALALAGCGGGGGKGAPPPAAPAPHEVYVETTAGMDLELVWIPGGKFIMGSPESEAGRDANEGPQHPVELSGYWIGKFPVTQAQWTRVLGNNPSELQGSERFPVEQVAWDDAMNFCLQLSKNSGRRYALPTEAQWEHACRAGTTTRFSFGDDDAPLAEHAWFRANAGDLPHDVGQKKPNAWGLHDMHGNVWEWCLDWHGPYSAEPAKDPRAPDQNAYRVLRGGCKFDGPKDCRSAARHKLRRDTADNYIGFRVVLAPEGENP